MKRCISKEGDKKFFLDRNRLLKIRDDGGPNKVLAADFEKMLSEQILRLYVIFCFDFILWTRQREFVAIA